LRHGARPSAVGVVVNGIDPQRFRREPRRRDEVRAQLGVTPDAVLIGSVGRLEPQKRFDLLIDAIAALRHRHPELRLVIAGAGSLHDALSAQIARLELATTCRLLGHQADVRALYHALDLFVQSSDYEGTSNAVLEAMAMETPVVATNVGGTAELIEHDVDGVLVPPGSADTLALAIAAVIGDPERMTRLRVAARRTVEDRLSFRARMKSIEQVYRDICSRPSEHGPHA
jgi:glycosyltransferase involved in cell wall biosynthesis